jgi:hypothetical protein
MRQSRPQKEIKQGGLFDQFFYKKWSTPKNVIKTTQKLDL